MSRPHDWSRSSVRLLDGGDSARPGGGPPRRRRLAALAGAAGAAALVVVLIGSGARLGGDESLDEIEIPVLVDDLGEPVEPVGDEAEDIVPAAPAPEWDRRSRLVVDTSLGYVTWQPAVAPQEFDAADMVGPVYHQGRFFVVSLGSRSELWSTEDGAEWSGLPLPAGFAPHGLAAGSDGLVIAGAVAGTPAALHYDGVFTVVDLGFPALGDSTWMATEWTATQVAADPGADPVIWSHVAAGWIDWHSVLSDDLLVDAPTSWFEYDAAEAELRHVTERARVGLWTLAVEAEPGLIRVELRDPESAAVVWSGEQEVSGVAPDAVADHLLATGGLATGYRPWLVVLGEATTTPLAPPAPLLPGTIDSVAGADGDLVALSHNFFPYPVPRPTGALWHTTDGRHWDDLTGSFDIDHRGSLDHVASRGGRTLLVGAAAGIVALTPRSQARVPREAAWTTTDRDLWQRAPVFGADRPYRGFQQLFPSPIGWFMSQAVCPRECSVEVSLSADGLEWHGVLAAAPRSPLGRLYATGVTAGNGRVMVGAVEEFWDGATSGVAGELWIGTFGRPEPEESAIVPGAIMRPGGRG